MITEKNDNNYKKTVSEQDLLRSIKEKQGKHRRKVENATEIVSEIS